MRYHILATDYDGTLAHNERVAEETLKKLEQLKVSNRTIVSVTGRELKDIERVFPEYKVFDYIVAENGAVVHTVATGEEELLGTPPDESFINALQQKGVAPLSVGKVIVATWEPHEKAVLDIIKASGIERQLIFNKGAVMVLPAGVNKATGLQALLKLLQLSVHNMAAIGDAENDGSMLQVAECSVAVSNALPALKSSADFVTAGDHGQGVRELIDELLKNDLESITARLMRYKLSLGTFSDGSIFSINPYRSGILLSGISGGGKTTLTVSITEILIKTGYQFCLIDPEGDYLELPGAVIIGNETSSPALDEMAELLKNPEQNLVICIMSVSMEDRPAFFSKFLPLFLALRKNSGHPHWLLIDEAHHLIPVESDPFLFKELNNFLLISYLPGKINPVILEKTGMVMTVGDDIQPVRQFCFVRKIPVPKNIPVPRQGEVNVFDAESNQEPYIIKYNAPQHLQQRHKRKYALGDMGESGFIFSGSEGKLNLNANNLQMFAHLAEGIDDETWQYHLKKHDYTKWFNDFVHDDELAAISEHAENEPNPLVSRKKIIDYIREKYMAG